MDIKCGDEITINARVMAGGVPGRWLVETPGGNYLWIYESDINTIHPYKEPPTEDVRKGS
jgi:hypothetical protein